MRGEINTVHIHISFQNLIFLKIIILSQDGQPLPLYESNHYVNHNIIENVQSNLYVPNIHFFMHSLVHAAYIYYWLLFPIFCKSFWVSLMTLPGGIGAGREGDNRGWDGWMASLTLWTWVWMNSGSWWWTGRPGVLRFMELQRVEQDWATELNWWLRQ